MSQESEPTEVPVSTDLSIPLGFAATLPKQAATVLTDSDVLEWCRLSSASPVVKGAPSWDPSLVIYGQKEILQHSETLGTPLDIPLVNCFIKAAHMVNWYNNTVDIWAHSLISGDYGESLVETGCALRSILYHNARQSSRLCGRWTALAQFGLLETYLKWVTAKFFADSLRQEELPPAPGQLEDLLKHVPMQHLYTGVAWLHVFGRRPTIAEGRKWRFAFGKDIYMTKNASLPVEDSFVEKSLVKHLNTLCGDVQDKLSDETFDEVCEAIQLCADEVFGPVRDQKLRWNEIYEEKPLEAKAPSRLPSFGASFQGKRSGGGACGDLLRNYHDVGSLPEPDQGYLFCFAQKPGSPDICEVRTLHDPSLYEEAEKEWCREAYALASDGVAAEVVPLVEPFKVRTITKGQAEVYHLARRWQKIIHRRMRKHPNFQLIGQPCNGRYLSEIFGDKELFQFRKDKKGFFVSGDYESATDLLNPALSEFAQEQISQRLRIPLEDQLVLKQCLTGHRLRYLSDDNAELFKQNWGQLMGSPTSFPVLCLVNMAATLVSYNRAHQKSFKLSDLPTCVNGDDILFWAKDPRHYEIWKQITGECGLKFSLGKNYTSREACIINSELYLYQEEQRCLTRPAYLFRLEKAVNSRLLCGGTRSSATSGFDPLSLSDSDLPIYVKAVGGPGAFRRLTGSKITGPNRRPLTPGQLLSQLRKQYRQQRFAEDYGKWFNTIPSRQKDLLEQHDGEIHAINDVRPMMRRKLLERFTELQIKRIERFRRCEPRTGVGLPFYVPQPLGGLGLIAPHSHEYTIQDELEILTLKGSPEEAFRWVQGLKPKVSSVSFMEAVRAEISEIQDTLEIERALVPAADIESLRYNGEDNQFWELTFLAGFVDENNVTVDPDSRQREYEHLERLLNSRGWKSKKLSAEKVRQTNRLLKEGIISESDRILGGDGKVRWMGRSKHEIVFHEVDFCLVSTRLSPRFV
nr:MAG: putative RNA-dependent RNA polymerase [Narnaviridae sp.]